MPLISSLSSPRRSLIQPHLSSPLPFLVTILSPILFSILFLSNFSHLSSLVSRLLSLVVSFHYSAFFLLSSLLFSSPIFSSLLYLRWGAKLFVSVFCLWRRTARHSETFVRYHLSFILFYFILFYFIFVTSRHVPIENSSFDTPFTSNRYCSSFFLCASLCFHL